MKSIVISGPTGAIGMALIQKCIQENVRVLAVCRKGSARIKYIPNSAFVKVIEADLCDYKQLFWSDHLGEPYDVFYHFAWSGTVGEARNDMRLQTDNIAYTMDAVELAERLGCHTFIGAGSQAEYGRMTGKLTPDVPANPENGYGMAKLCAGQMSRVVCRQTDIIVRNPYSIRPYQHVLEPIAVYLMIAAKQYENSACEGSYNVGPDETDCYTTGELVTLFCDKWRRTTGQQITWKNEYDGGPHEANFLKLDCSKLKKTFGWKPVWNVEKAMEMIVEWSVAWQDGKSVERIMERQLREFLSVG